MRWALLLVAASLVASTGCRRRPRAPVGPAATVLSPDAPPICGDFGRAYFAPGSTGQIQPATAPPGYGQLGPVDSRIVREGQGFASYSAQDQALIRSGRARRGLDERALYLANGLPAFYWNVSFGETPCRVLLYGTATDSAADTVIYTCEQQILHIAPVDPPLPCWRVAQVAPRAIERAAHFDGAGLHRQWEILHGLLRRGQSIDDVYVAFGAPYRTGTEAREDGVNALQHVYLDSTGDAYASYLTFIDRELRAWRFPPERVLTSEAEQRRLNAMEQRMMDQLRSMEAASMARHQEEMARLGTIQNNQERIREDIEAMNETMEQRLSEPRVSVAVQVDPNMVPGAGLVGAAHDATNALGNEVRRELQEDLEDDETGGPGRPPRGCWTFVLNGDRYADLPGTPIGRRCGRGCPDGYICVEPFHQCMPHPDPVRCSE